MGIVEITLLGIGLAMDAFAVSICKGLSMKKMNWKKCNNNRIILWNISSIDASNRIFPRDNI